MKVMEQTEDRSEHINGANIYNKKNECKAKMYIKKDTIAYLM